MASSNAKGQNPEESQLGDAIYRVAVILWVQEHCSNKKGFKRSYRNNAVTIFTSESFQIWLAKKNRLNLTALSPRLLSQKYEAEIGRISLERGYEVAIKTVIGHMDQALGNSEFYFGYIRDLPGNSFGNTWTYSLGKNKSWSAQNSSGNLYGEGNSKSEARAAAIFNHYFPD